MIPAGRWWRGWRGRGVGAGGGQRLIARTPPSPLTSSHSNAALETIIFPPPFVSSLIKKTKKDAQWSSGVGHTEQSLCNQQQIWVIDSVNYFVIDSVKTIVN